MFTVISGGQTGADRGGLIAAKKAGFTTGGWMPKGFKALDGNHPEFLDIYGLIEHPSPLYPPRTFANVKQTDVTIRFAVNFQTAGELCTLKAIEKYGKPHFDVDVLGTTTPGDLVHWLRHLDKRPEALNIAGNSERTAPGIEEFVVAFLLETFGMYLGRHFATD